MGPPYANHANKVREGAHDLPIGCSPADMILHPSFSFLPSPGLDLPVPQAPKAGHGRKRKTASGTMASTMETDEGQEGSDPGRLVMSSGMHIFRFFA